MMQFIDLAMQQRRIRKEIEERIQNVLNHGQYIMGPEIGVLEEKLSDYVGVKHAIGCASGTDALLLALMAYDVGPGDAVLTTPFTFMATAEVIALLGATPVFVDCHPRTFNMDPLQLEKAVAAMKKNDPSLHPLPKSPGSADLRLRGIMPADLFGLTAEYDAINAIAAQHGLFVIQDAAQSFGGEYAGRKACAMAHIGCTSFFPAKPLGAYGDGGMCFTDDDALARIMRSLRVHGQGSDKYENVRIGINGRLDTFQAAILLAKFEIFPEEVKLRQQVARRYSQLLETESSPVVPPIVQEDYVSAWAQYSVLSKEEGQRPKLQARLKEAQIPTAVYYPKPLHLQSAFSFLGYANGDFPVSEDCAQRIFSLPMHPYLRQEDQERVASVLTGKGVH